MSKLNGKVKFYNNQKGFGFVIESQTSKEYFMHATSLLDEVKENDEVSFELKENGKGPCAVNVQLVN